jgi:quercetin dioxygenase-like cupin family protein
MIALKKHARPLLFVAAVGLLAAGIAPSLGQRAADGAGGYVLGPDEGEALTRGPTTIRVKADPTRGSSSMSVGTQLLPKGAGIPLHQHTVADEVLYVLEGSGVGLLGESRAPLQKGSAIFIPKGAWHGVQNPDGELLVLWIVTPPGLEAMFREATPKPGPQAVPLTREQFLEIARKHGTMFK